jgi:hypothetical protein
VTGSASRADALRRRLRDDPGAARALDALRRAAYGRAASDAPLAEVPEHVRAASGIAEDVLPQPLLALLVEEDRLVGEGRTMLAEDAAAAPVPRPEETAADPDAEDADPVAGDATPVERDAGSLSDRPRRRLLRPAPIAAALAGLLLVAGLGTASASGLLADDDSWRSQEPTSTPGPPSTPDPRIGMPVPAFTAQPPAQAFEQLDEVETAIALREQADMQWESVRQATPDAARPEVAFERVVTPEEWMTQRAACLREAGVDVEVIGTGDDQRLTYVAEDPLLDYACDVRFPLVPHGPMTTAMLAYLHDYYVSFLLPCYASEGAPYRGDVPDLAEHIARDRAGQGWFPEPSSQSGAIAFRCPQDPDLAP